MDFNNRGVQTQQGVTPGSGAPAGRKSHGRNDSTWKNVVAACSVAAVTILLVAAILVVSTTSVKSEAKFVDNTKLQAIFLNTGQVYFGNVKVLNSKYIVLSGIYYLQTSNSTGSSSTSAAANNVSLVKLGCELHQPFDQMVINANQVTFWENLQGSGQVAKAVKAFQQQNPAGRKCSDQSSSASTTSGSNTQNAGTSTTPTTTTTTTTKP